MLHHFYNYNEVAVMNGNEMVNNETSMMNGNDSMNIESVMMNSNQLVNNGNVIIINDNQFMNNSKVELMNNEIDMISGTDFRNTIMNGTEESKETLTSNEIDLSDYNTKVPIFHLKQ